MQDKFFSRNLDFFGFSASALCAIHCISLPFLFSIGALGGLNWLENEWLEFGFILVSMVVASWSLGQSYFKQHNKIDAILMALLGFAFIFLSRILMEGLEPILMMLGGSSIAIAHFYNWKMVHRSAAQNASLETLS